jgi:hypothetical protein
VAKDDKPKLAVDQQTVAHLKSINSSQSVAHLRNAVQGTTPVESVERQQTVAHLAKPLGSGGSTQSGSQGGQGSQGKDGK